MIVYEGLKGSDGIGIGRLYRYESEVIVERRVVQNVKLEREQFQRAVTEAKEQLQHLYEKTKRTLSEEEATIFEAHILILQDVEWVTPIEEQIESGTQASIAVREVSRSIMSIFEQMDDAYMQERARDIYDVSERVVRILEGVTQPTFEDVTEPIIIVAKDVTPSDTMQFPLEYVKAIVTEAGGVTSHAVILANTLGIPAVVGTGPIKEKEGRVIVDGSLGKVHLNPSERLEQQYETKFRQLQEEEQLLKQFIHSQGETADGTRIMMYANVGSLEDVERANNDGAEGIGLFRTEFLYMDRTSLPSEEEQFKLYKETLQLMGERPVTIRTLDIGGDKEVQSLSLPKEENPFLGLRAIRLTFEYEEVFRTQLRALLRAAPYGQLKIMFPLIATMEEWKRAERILKEEYARLKEEGIDAQYPEVGMMIEVPSAVILAPQFAKVVDFFSIGTNDLIQYSFAVDRMNEKVSAHLYSHHHPALLQMIRTVKEAGEKEGIPVTICGEMGGDLSVLPYFIAIGMDGLSMTSRRLSRVKATLKQLNDSSHFVEQVEQATTKEEIEQLLTK
ncbi:MAG TPA: phosphoenolpyruvate--protein phosphotransferase [Savagea sp.]